MKEQKIDFKEMNKDNDQGEIVIYQTDDGDTKIDVRFVDETVWLTQAQLCELYQTSKSNVSEHIKNIFEDGEWAIMEWKDSLGLRGCGFFHVKDNKIVFQRGYWDKLSFLKQHNLPIE